MTATAHAITGSAVAVVTYGTWGWSWPVCLAAALASHFICDALPHWDYVLKFPLKKYVACFDVLVGLIVALIVAAAITTVPAWIIIVGAILAMLPDAMWWPRGYIHQPLPTDGNKALYKLRKFHRWVQWSEVGNGLWVEAGWFLVMVIVIVGANHGLADSL